MRIRTIKLAIHHSWSHRWTGGRQGNQTKIFPSFQILEYLFIGLHLEYECWPFLYTPTVQYDHWINPKNYFRERTNPELLKVQVQSISSDGKI